MADDDGDDGAAGHGRLTGKALLEGRRRSGTVAESCWTTLACRSADPSRLCATARLTEPRLGTVVWLFTTSMVTTTSGVISTLVFGGGEVPLTVPIGLERRLHRGETGVESHALQEFRGVGGLGADDLRNEDGARPRAVGQRDGGIAGERRAGRRVAREHGVACGGIALRVVLPTVSPL